MRKIFFIILLLTITFSSINFASAQGMMGFPNSSPDNATIQSQQQEEQEGKNLLKDLSSKTVACLQLKDADFEKIGEYFMGQSIGDTSRHIVMNEMMKRMMGEQGEEQMHAAMGKRMSNCEPNAPMPQNMAYSGMMGMMNMVSGGLMGLGAMQSMMGNNPLSFGVPFLGFGYFGIWNILYTVLLIGVIALVFLGAFKIWKDINKKEVGK